MNSKRPLVSVVIPAFNAAATLQQTIDSVMGQTCPSFELLIVDDGSTDDTAAIAECARIRDQRVRILRQENAGVGAARNAAIAVARGEYIAPLDADDLWAPQKLEKQVARLEDSGPRAGLAYGWSRNIDARGRVTSWAHPCRLEGRVGAAILLGNLAGNASVPLFRTSALHAVGGYLQRDQQHGAQGCEDWDLNIRVAERFELCCVPEYLVSYRQSPSGMSLKATAMLRSYEVTIRRALQRNPHLSAPLLSWSRSRFYLYLASKCYAWSDYAGALSFTARTLKLDPLAWLNSRNYRVGLFSLAHLLSSGVFRRHRFPPPVTSNGDPLFRITPSCFATDHSLFARFERRRLAFAMTVHARRHPGPAETRPAFS